MATVTVGTSPFGVAFNPNTDKIYVSNFLGNTVSVINSATDTVIGSPIAVGTHPWGVGVNPTTNKIYVSSLGGNNVSVINGATDTVVGSPIAVGAGPYGVGVNPTTNKIYVANNGGNTVSVINGVTDTVIASPAVGTGPYGIGVNPTTNKIYVSNDNGSSVSVINGATGTVIGSPIAVGAGPSAVGVNPATAKIYAANRSDNTVTILYDPSVPKTTGLSPDHKAAGDSGFTITVNGTGFIKSSVVRWKGADRTTTYHSSSRLTASIPASDIKTVGTARVTVFTPGAGESNSRTFTISKAIPPTAWYLAEGTTAWGFSTQISIENPNTSRLSARVTYMPSGASPVTETVSLPAGSQTTLTNDHLLSVMKGPRDFSTRVTCTDATRSIAVDRTMTWTGTGAPSPEGHSSVGVTSPAKTWYLPEGSSKWGFECWLLIQNPNSTTAHCTVTYMIEGAGPKTVTHDVPANSRASFNMVEEPGVGQADASIKVVSSVPVIPERAMYRNNRREGHDSIGTTTPATDYYLAEGTSNWGFTTYVLVQNPNASPAIVTLTYMASDGPHPQPAFRMDPNSRKTVRVNEILPGKDFSTRVHADKPIIAERAMYWGAGTPLGEACHDSIGMPMAHRVFYLPDGQTSGGYETWTLVQNPNSTPVSVKVDYLTPSGTGNKTLTRSIPANSRQTFNMADKVPSGRASIEVTCLTSGKRIMVERAMYWNNRGAGTDTIGGYSD